MVNQVNKNYSLKHLILYFLKLGATGFGGSIALAHSMQSELVEKRKWITPEEFKRGLTLSQLSPGPLAAQLAIYIGFVKSRKLGATAAGVAFILPSFLLVLAFSIFYSYYGTISIVQAIFYGIGAAVVGIIASSGYELTKKTMPKKFLPWIIYGVVLVFTVVTRSANVGLFILAGLLTMIVYSKEKLRIPKVFAVVPFVFSSSDILSSFFSLPFVKIFFFFLMAGTIAFGGGLAIVPFLQNGVVTQYHWLTNKQFSDAISIAMITPGPVVIAATFIGYFTAQVPGAIIATVAIFTPVYLIVLFLTPFFNKHAQNPRMIAFIEGVIAAAMASIAGSVFILGQTSLVDFSTFSIAVLSLLAVRFLKLPGIIVIVIAGVVGILLYR